MIRGLNFKRIVLGLQPGTPDRSMDIAVDLANLLQLELLALFIEDTSVRQLASMPFARELRLLGYGWQPIDSEQMSHEFALAASSVQQAFATAAKRHSNAHQFEVVQGSIPETISAISRTSDIIMVVEPVNPVERATYQFSRLTEAAVRSAAAVLLVPNKVARTSGPIVVIARSVDDPSFPVAAAIATAAKEQLIIMETQGNTLLEDGIRNLIDEFGFAIKPVFVRRMPSVDPSVFISAMPGVKEQLVILVRGGHENLSRVALTRGIPVLLVEPG